MSEFGWKGQTTIDSTTYEVGVKYDNGAIRTFKKLKDGNDNPESYLPLMTGPIVYSHSSLKITDIRSIYFYMGNINILPDSFDNHAIDIRLHGALLDQVNTISLHYYGYSVEVDDVDITKYSGVDNYIDFKFYGSTARLFGERLKAGRDQEYPYQTNIFRSGNEYNLDLNVNVVLNNVSVYNGLMITYKDNVNVPI